VKCSIGIDLGSTTTKAIILDESAQVVGRGLTNSRSDYLVASQVARSEALINARFEMLRGMLGADDDETLTEFLARLRVRFKYEQLHEHWRHLRRICLEEVEDARYAEHGAGLRDAMTELFRQMEGRMEAHITSFQDDDSLFFRDVASSQYMDLAQEIAGETGISFDLLVGFFDKAILLVENQVLEQSFRESAMAALAAIDAPASQNGLGEAVSKVSDIEFEVTGTMGTGYGRLTLPFEKDEISSEILCHGLGAHAMFAGTRTVLDIGGQDMKAIQVDENGIVDSFQMNDRCAAGTGRYLGYIADELNLALHQLGPMASKAEKPSRISSTCTVFAGTEFREKLALGHKREDILAGLHRAIILRAMSLLARSGGVREEFTFTGGVAKNGAAVRELRKLVDENYGESISLNIHPDSIYTGAVGAALFAMRRDERAAASVQGGSA